MFINKNSIEINNVKMGQYITEVTYGYHKLWSSDSGRNLAGTQSGTLIGIFPKITLQFRKLTRDEIELLAPIFDSATQTTTYYDAKKGTSVTMSTYSGDWELKNKNFIDSARKAEPFSWAVISKKKRA